MSNYKLIPLTNGSDVKAKATVALAVASLCVGAAQAATVASRTGASNMSLERSQRVAATESTALGAISFTVGSTYDSGDEITFTLSGTSATIGLAATDTVTVTCSAGATSTDMIEITSSGNKSSTLRTFRYAPSNNASVVANGTLCTVAGLTILDTSVGTTAGNTVLLRVTGRDGSTNAAIDTNGSATQVSSLVDEWQVAVSTALDGVVDNKKSGRQYTDGAADGLVLTVTNQALLNTMASAASTNALVVTIGGDFSYLVNGSGESLGATGQLSIAALAGANSAASMANHANGDQYLQLIGTGTSVTGLRLQVRNTELDSASTTFGVTFGNVDASTGNAILAQNFPATSSYRLAFADGSSETGSTLDAGNWTSNGVNVFVPYMPVGSGIVSTLYWVNNSSSSGTVTIRVRGEGASACSSSQTVSVGPGMNSLSTAYGSLIAACQTSGTVSSVTDKVFITLSGTTPVGTSEVYSSFTVGGTSRVTVPNSSTGYKGNPSTDTGTRNIGQDNADNR